MASAQQKEEGKHLNNQGVSLLFIDVECGKSILKKRWVTTDYPTI